MDLEKANKLSDKITDLTGKIQRQKKNKEIVKHLNRIEIETQPSNQRPSSFRMVENSFVGLRNLSVKAFKTLLVEEIDEQIAIFEKELDQLIKKGIE